MRSGDVMTNDIFWIVSILFLFFTIVMTALYYKRMKKVTNEYAEAKNVVSDITVSFNKQMQRQEEHLGKVSYRMEALSERGEDMAAKVEGLEPRIIDVVSKLNKSIENLKEKMGEVEKAQEEIKKQALKIPEVNIEAVIPIKKERALAPLTETELHILEIIAEGGEKNAPEIKDLIKLTREHTARLVKKLYEDGYLERNTEKTPYAYRVKEEMLKILKKIETETKN